MTVTNFNTRNDTWRKLMGNGVTYKVPRYQRDYSWSESEWEDLWLDLQAVVTGQEEPAHYLGYLVLQTQDDKQFEVIDGQQRLTTISLLVLAVVRHLQGLVASDIDAADNQRRAEQLRHAHLGYLDPVTLLSRSKLELNRNNDAYYQNYLITLTHPLPVRGFRASEHRLRKAFEWFVDRLSKWSPTETKAGEESRGLVLARLVENLSDKLFFTVITVTDELNAYKVFETLNARGVKLSATDLLKNHLFSVLFRSKEHEKEIEAAEKRWDDMVARLGDETFTDFLRAHWISRHTLVREAELFKRIRAKVTDRGQVFALLREMDQDLDTYLALRRPEDSEWPLDLREPAETLRRFGVRQPLPLLLAARRSLADDPSFARVLRACVSISFRYNVIGGRPTPDQERVYALACGRLARGEVTQVRDVLLDLRPIYPTDAEFIAAFGAKSLRAPKNGRNRQVLVYVLGAIERHTSGNQVELDSSALSLEHVFPEHADSGWESFADAEVDEMVWRLGNLTLVPPTENRNLGRQPYAVKRDAYRNSAFGLTRMIAENFDRWDPRTIAAHQNWMAKQAKTIWRIAELS